MYAHLELSCSLFLLDIASLSNVRWIWLSSGLQGVWIITGCYMQL
jgi:hypothetical protein